ncbi:complement C1q tumor necrosis factor-related protein 3-like [Littorina saxatilis]|uniref:C1q domain-containing protein n=1 Tax=Littorina saxatilis TaxID=31220 RepID=A0AAN9AJA8_9CAEN
MAVVIYSLLLLGAFIPLIQTADDVNALQTVVEQLSQKMTSLTAHVTQQDNKMVAMETLLGQKAATITELQQSVTTLKNQMALQSPFVAFDVQFKDDPHNGVLDHEIIKFDSVVTNIGNAYNLHNGMFQAPVTGVYLFHVKVTPHPKGHIYVYLDKEGVDIDSAIATDATAIETGDSTRIVQLTKGERVWLKKNDGVTSVRGWAHTKLAGYLLRAT